LNYLLRGFKSAWSTATFPISGSPHSRLNSNSTLAKKHDWSLGEMTIILKKTRNDKKANFIIRLVSSCDTIFLKYIIPFMAFWMFLLIMADVSAAQFAANNQGLWILLGKGQNPSQRQLRQAELVHDSFERDFGLSKVQWQAVFPLLKRVFFSHTHGCQRLTNLIRELFSFLVPKWHLRAYDSEILSATSQYIGEQTQMTLGRRSKDQGEGFNLRLVMIIFSNCKLPRF
jgi:hypothetical protein